MTSVAERDNDAGAEDDAGESEVHFVTTKEARHAIETIRSFVEQSNDVEDNVFSAIVTIENAIDRQYKNTLKQSKITDFFNTGNQ